MMPVGRIRA